MFGSHPILVKFKAIPCGMFSLFIGHWVFYLYWGLSTEERLKETFEEKLEL